MSMQYFYLGNGFESFPCCVYGRKYVDKVSFRTAIQPAQHALINIVTSRI